MLSSSRCIAPARAFVTIVRQMSEGGVGLHSHNSQYSVAPLISMYQSSWPKPKDLPLPTSGLYAAPLPRTIPDDKLTFQMKATFAHGSSIFYPHLKFHPSDFKVGLVVNMTDLGLTAVEQSVLRELCGPRYNPGSGVLRLTAEKFPNRMENKKYVTYLLEKLVAEAKRIASIAHEYDEKPVPAN